MATTTNYGWTTPDDTALVKDGAAAIRTLGSSIDTTTKNLNPSTTLGDIEYRSSTANVNTRLPLGTAGQVLKVNSGATAPEWATDATGMTNPMTTTGDTIYSSSGSTPARLGIGSTGNVLTVAGGVPTWAAPAAAGGLTLLSTTTLSGTTVDISSISQDYKNLRIFVKDMIGTVDNLQPKLRLNNDSNSRYVWGLIGARIGNGTTDSGASGSTATSVWFANGSAGTDFNRRNYVSLFLPRYTDGTRQFIDMSAYSSADATNTNWGSYFLNGVYDAQAAITSINLFSSNGSFNGGTVYIYGEK